jgi:hypothetical protein
MIKLTRILPFLALSLTLYACSSAQLAETGSVVTDLVTDVQAGAVAYVDAQTALSGAQQAMGGHGISIGNIGQYAQAASSSANTSGLATAISTVVSDVSSQYAALKAAGATPTTAAATVEQTITAAQVAVTPPVTTTAP